MSRLPSFSSSSTSSSLSPRFDSGIQQSVSRFSSSTESKRTGWEIHYNELKFGNLLGQGTYGKVYTGIFREIKVAIKVYDLHSTLPSEQQSEVLKEAGLMARLPKSPYLIGFHGVSFDQNYCLVMEYAEGGTLQTRLNKTSGKLTLPQQMRWAMQISYGLNQLHSLNILHRDLKSKNILLNNREEAKVGDFGLSVVKSTSISQSKTSDAMGAAGTLPWMAPELFTGKANSKQTDIYSLGIVLWEIINREVPFKDKMAGVIVGMVLAGNRETLPKKCPELFKLMITGCWNQDAKNRPDAQQVGYQFETALRSLESLPSSLLSVEKKSLPIKATHSPVTKTITTSSYSPTVSQSWQTSIPAPKSLTRVEQLKLQDQLILACKQGDEKAVTALFRQGAKPDMTNTGGEQPLGAAVWGMCPGVVNALIKQAEGIAPMLWLECEEHNLDCYKEIFIIPEFDPRSLAEWYALVQKIDTNLFIRAFHLKKVDEYWHNSDTSSWDNLRSYLHDNQNCYERDDPIRSNRTIPSWTEDGFVRFRTQIQQSIEIASCQRVYPNSHSPLLQDRLIVACKQGDEKAVRALLKQGAKPDIANLKDEQPLIIACKQGDEEVVRALLKQGAKPDIATLKGEQPLGAAVWSMCPGVVNALLEQEGGIASMGWEECEKHNLNHYNEVFIIPKFDPKTFEEWETLKSKLSSNGNLFMQMYYQKKLDEQWRGNDAYSWENAKRWLSGAGLWKDSLEQVKKEAMYGEVTARAIEEEYVSYRTQIKQNVERVSRSKTSSNDSDTALPHYLRGSPVSRSSQILMPAPKSLTGAEQLKLQDQLITACKLGDEKAVKALLKKGARPDMTNAGGEQPFGAAVWGMCPEVVNALLKQVGGVAPMTWDECKEHNLKYYKEVFIMPKFDPQTYQDWHSLLLKMDSSPFLQSYQLEKARENWNTSYLSYVSSWETFKSKIWSDRTVKSMDGKIVLSSCINSLPVREMQSGLTAFKIEIERMMLSKPSIGSSYNLQSSYS